MSENNLIIGYSCFDKSDSGIGRDAIDKLLGIDTSADRMVSMETVVAALDEARISTRDRTEVIRVISEKMGWM